MRVDNDIPRWAPLTFIEVAVIDASDFETQLHVVGEERSGHRILTVRSSVVANTIAEVLLAARDRTSLVPHVYFTWTEGNPFANLLRFSSLAPERSPRDPRSPPRSRTRPEQRPRVHVS